jgi:hypothetical protein
MPFRFQRRRLTHSVPQEVTYRSIHAIPAPLYQNTKTYKNGQGRLTDPQSNGHIWRTAAGYAMTQTHNHIHPKEHPRYGEVNSIRRTYVHNNFDQIGQSRPGSRCSTSGSQRSTAFAPAQSRARDATIKDLQTQLRTLQSSKGVQY